MVLLLILAGFLSASRVEASHWIEEEPDAQHLPAGDEAKAKDDPNSLLFFTCDRTRSSRMLKHLETIYGQGRVFTVPIKADRTTEEFIQKTMANDYPKVKNIYINCHGIYNDRTNTFTMGSNVLTNQLQIDGEKLRKLIAKDLASRKGLFVVDTCCAEGFPTQQCDGTSFCFACSKMCTSQNGKTAQALERAYLHFKNEGKDKVTEKDLRDFFNAETETARQEDRRQEESLAANPRFQGNLKLVETWKEKTGQIKDDGYRAAAIKAIESLHQITEKNLARYDLKKDSQQSDRVSDDQWMKQAAGIWKGFVALTLKRTAALLPEGKRDELLKELKGLDDLRNPTDAGAMKRYIEELNGKLDRAVRAQQSYAERGDIDEKLNKVDERDIRGRLEKLKDIVIAAENVPFALDAYITLKLIQRPPGEPDPKYDRKYRSYIGSPILPEVRPDTVIWTIR